MIFVFLTRFDESIPVSSYHSLYTGHGLEEILCMSTHTNVRYFTDDQKRNRLSIRKPIVAEFGSRLIQPTLMFIRSPVASLQEQLR
jgi:hypothetical protein